MAPAWPDEEGDQIGEFHAHLLMRPTVMSEVEAAVDPNSFFADGLILLGIDRPFTWSWDFDVHRGLGL
jgi:hypothetical protein